MACRSAMISRYNKGGAILSFLLRTDLEDGHPRGGAGLIRQVSRGTCAKGGHGLGNGKAESRDVLSGDQCAQ